MGVRGSPELMTRLSQNSFFFFYFQLKFGVFQGPNTYHPWEQKTVSVPDRCVTNTGQEPTLCAHCPLSWALY